MGKLFETIRSVHEHSDTIQTRAYGVIEVADSVLVGIHFRPYPKLISSIEASWMGGWQHKRIKRDRCWLYYNQPISSPSYLAVPYLKTAFSTSFKTVRCALSVLDQIAKIKSTDAILAEVTNPRMTDRVLSRMGWSEHLQHKRGRHFIKRFYGDYAQCDFEIRNTGVEHISD